MQATGQAYAPCLPAGIRGHHLGTIEAKKEEW